MSSKTISTLVNIRCKANNRRFFRITSRIVAFAVILHRRISSRVFLRVLLFLRPDHHPHEEEEDDHRVRSLPLFELVYQTHRSFTVSISPFTITFQFHYLHHHLHSFFSAISRGFISYFYYRDIYLASLVIFWSIVNDRLLRSRVDSRFWVLRNWNSVLQEVRARSMQVFCREKLKLFMWIVYVNCLKWIVGRIVCFNFGSSNMEALEMEFSLVEDRNWEISWRIWQRFRKFPNLCFNDEFLFSYFSREKSLFLILWSKCNLRKMISFFEFLWLRLRIERDERILLKLIYKFRYTEP